MSTLATNAITDASGGNTATINSYTPTESNMAGRNRIINGDMRIDQRNAGASVTPADGAYTLDRWVYLADQASKCTIEQTISGVSAPTGFSDYLGVTSTASTTITTSQQFAVVQRVEGFNMADLAWGTASAATVTLSFWVRSSLTGTFGGALRNNAGNYNYPFSYTISASNTWEQKSVTISGPTSGTWTISNGRCLQVAFSLGAGATLSGTAGAWTSSNHWSATGATQVLATSGATFYLTGVQLEAGSVATPFEHRQYGQELALCQRYLPAFTAQSGTVGPLPGIATALGTNCVLIFNHPVPARVPGTGVGYSSATHFNFSNNDGNSSSTAVAFAAGSPSATQLTITVAVTRGATTTPGWFYANNASAILYITGCEL